MNVQMNVRIDEQVKRSGDEVFGRMGLTPSQVVRSVWEYAAMHHEAPEIVWNALNPLPSREQRIDGEIAEASSICARMRNQFGLKAPDQLEELDYRAMRERALYERMEERGLA